MRPTFSTSAPPRRFERNQFGGAVGGPIEKDKTFVFANYEGFRQSLHQTSVTFVPDASARAGTFVPLGSGCPLAQQAACAAEVTSLLNLWPIANGPDNPSAGIAQYFSSPLQKIHEDFGTARLDRIFSNKDSAMGVYTIDDSGSVTATPFDPFATDIVTLREQVFSLEETHIFSPSIVNTARVGFSRAGYFFTGEPTPGTPAASVPGFVGSLSVGAVVVGGSQASNPQSQLGLAGSNNGSNLFIARNLFTYSDQLSVTKPGGNQFTAGVWFQRLQSNEQIALSQFGQMTFSGVPGFLAGVGSFLYDPAPTPLSWRSLYGAWYVEDAIRIRRNLTVTLGFRDELTTGWNEAYGRASNYSYPNGTIATQPTIGNNLFSVNHAKGLMQPRAAVAWSPFGTRTVVRAGVGVYNDLQDALGYRADQNAPFNPTYTIASGSIAALHLPINPTAPPAANALLVPGGVRSGHAHSDRHHLFPAYRAATFAQHFADGRIRRQPWLPRADRSRRQRSETRGLPGQPLPGEFPEYGRLGSAGGRRGSGRNIFHRPQHKKAESATRQYLDLVFRRDQQLQRAGGGPETPVQPRTHPARRLYLVESPG